MLVGIIILGFALIGISTAYAFLVIKYKSLKDIVESFLSESNKHARRGYIKFSLSKENKSDGTEEKFESLVTVKELDRYTNGESKVEIESINPGISEEKMSKKRIEDYIRTQFISIIKTTEVTWLESEETIKEQRKNKLERLKEVLNKKQ